jgi:hypothetical protein
MLIVDIEIDRRVAGLEICKNGSYKTMRNCSNLFHLMNRDSIMRETSTKPGKG